MKVPCRTLLLVILAASGLLEGIISGILFCDPATEARMFAIPFTPVPGPQVLARILAEFTALFTVLIAWSCRLLWRGNPAGHTLAAIFGGFWVVTGLTLWAEKGLPVYLVMDSLRGLVIMALVVWDRRTSRSAAALG